MRVQALVQYSMLVPEVADDTETPTLLLETFGGYTLTTGLSGAWTDAGRVYLDTNSEYRIAGPDTGAMLTKVRDCAASIGKRLHQQAVYITLPGGKAEILFLEEEAAA